MKIILRIIMVLLVASGVAGGFSLAVNNSSTASLSNDGGQLPAISSNSQSSQPMTRPEGSHLESGSITGGLSGVFVTLGKLTGIAILVVLIQKAFIVLGHCKLLSAQR
jgi:hypothetical protein